jgi:hypothetical protein
MMRNDRLKVIETRHNGYHFKSRLEARWSIFLDHLGITWEYEKEGFVVNGTCYLPDFWIHYNPWDSQVQGWGFWLEIKPVPLNDSQVKLLADLARLSGHRTYAICGSPMPGQFTVYMFDHHREKEPASIPMVAGGTLIEKPYGEFGEVDIDILWGGKTFGFPGTHKSLSQGTLETALEAARSARFGEKGRS